MSPRETAKSYDALAAYWHGDAFNRANGMEALRKAITFAKRRGRALDVGCGSSGRFIEHLLAEGFAAEGLDISPEMIRLAKQRHPQVTFHKADIGAWTAARPYDFIAAWDSIWHVPLHHQEAMMRGLVGCLGAEGVLLFTCGGLDSEDERTNPCRGQPLYHATLGLPRIQSLLLDAGCALRHVEFDQLPSPHAYMIAQKR